jgi:hypothetical protein
MKLVYCDMKESTLAYRIADVSGVYVCLWHILGAAAKAPRLVSMSETPHTMYSLPSWSNISNVNVGFSSPV